MRQYSQSGYIDISLGLNRSLHLPSWSWKESPSLSCPIAIEQIGSWWTYGKRIRIHMHLHVHKCPKSGTPVVIFGSDRNPIGSFIWTILPERILSYPNGHWDRDRSRHLKYIYRDLIALNLNKSFKDRRIDSHHLLLNPKNHKEVTRSVTICQL